MKASLTIFVFCFLLNVISYSQEVDSTQNFIFWSDDYRLIWTDFEKLPQRYSEHTAFSVIGYICEFEMNDRHYKVNIRTYFDRNNSWSKHWVPILLSHEQGHFDLAEIYARKFRLEILEAMKSGNISIKKFEQMSDAAMRRLEEAQLEYDKATNYSLDYRAQLKWNEHIKEELMKFDHLKNPEIVVSR
ncbi:MAG: DUF922 domain-containing protein [Balneolaceae bacterium]